MKTAPLCTTAYRIAEMQTASGAIPWEAGRHLDPWDHIEAAMALDAFGHDSAAAAAYAWLRKMQSDDGAWAARYENDISVDHTVDTNFCSYVAVGTWHHFITNGERQSLTRMWPVVESALDLAVGMQMPSGAIRWARDPDYRAWPGALLTASSCVFLSLRCGITIAEHLGYERPDWELALARLRDALVRQDDFESKDEFAMDWYYPVLVGAIEGEAAKERLDACWDRFVIEGRGCRCRDDGPWVTAGETSELALACWVAGYTDTARALLGWVDHLRDADGLYWTGANHPAGDIYPLEKTSWSAAAVLLANDAIEQDGPTAALFSGAGLVPADVLILDPDRLGYED